MIYNNGTKGRGVPSDGTGRMNSLGAKFCETCGRGFSRRRNEAKTTWRERKYCSRDCSSRREDRFTPVVGVGINDAGYIIAPATVGASAQVCPYYRAWSEMLRRCYCKKYQARQPTYIGCTVAPEWLFFKVFRSWMLEQDWQGKELDKDVLLPGNREYGPDVCCFVTRQINSLMFNRTEQRGKYLLGVGKHGNKFRARIRVNGVHTGLGSFETEEQAHQVYLVAKSNHIRNIANEVDEARVREGLLLHADLMEQRACD